MATDLISRYGNAFLVTEEYLMQGAQTVGNVTATVYETAGFPTNSAINIQVTFIAVNSTFTGARTGTILGTFYRDGANIIRDGAPSVTNVGALGVTATVNVNVANQSIILTMNGVAATTINYRAHIKLTIYK